MNDPVLNFIRQVRETFSGQESPNCWEFFCLLRTVFPEAEAWHDNDHVVTKIGKNFYDWKRGRIVKLGMNYIKMVKMEIKKTHRWKNNEV